MVPERLGVLPSQPLSKNGKIDKKNVKDWAESHCSLIGISDNYVEPKGDVEKEVASIWSQFLGGRQISRNDGFFECGGDSLSATRMISALSRIGVKASLKNSSLQRILQIFAKNFPSRTLAALRRSPSMRNRDSSRLI